MFRLTYGNRTESLLDALVRRIAATRGNGDPLEPTYIVVPNRNVERYVELGVAQRLGIAANLRMPRLAGFLREVISSEPLLLETTLRARVLRALLDDRLLSHASMESVRRYVHGAGDAVDAIDLRRVELALHLTDLYEEYSFSRPELLAAWSRDEKRFAASTHAATEAWQAELWRTLRAHPSTARTLAEAIDGTLVLPAQVHVFGLSYVARIFSRFFAALAERTELHLYTLNPCEEFWEDVESVGELRFRRRRSDAEPEWIVGEDPFRLSTDTETPLLRLWGRPGREHIRLLGALTECDFVPAFVDPIAEAQPRDDLPLFSRLSAPTLLQRLQHDVLVRAPRRETPDADATRDESLTILACPSIRREVESVAAEIWASIETTDGLTFDQIAVLVNGPERDVYLPHLSAVFEEAHGIPFNVADLSLASMHPLVEGALGLLALASTRFSRPDVLAVITHPSIRPPEIAPHEWVALCDRLGIFHGLDRHAHAGTYVEEDRLNWEQGLTRIALGAFADAAFVPIGDARYLPERSQVGDSSAASFALLVRSLSSDVRFASTASLSLTDWARFFGALLESYLRPEDDRAHSALRRALAAVATLADHDLGTPVSYTIAHELAKHAIASLSGGRGQQLADGVAVSSLLPMRAIPFRVIFVLGLGEGRFPAADRRDSMDLRTARREVGDVTPPERDRYTFLETLLCARDRLYLSYVAREPSTGEALEPASVVSELLEVIERAYLPNARERIVRWPRLRRHDDDAVTAVLPEAAAERRAQRLGRAFSEIDDAETLRRLAREDAMREALRLSALPERAVDPTTSTIRISLAALRRFLECPLQGWTRTVLRLSPDDAEAAAAIADEPFAPAPLEATIVLRESFLAHALTGIDPSEAYEAQVALRKAHGRWPVGALTQLAAIEHTEVLARFCGGLAQLAPERTWRVRFGAAESFGNEREEVLDPIVLAFDDDPRAPGSGRALRVEIVGATELLSDTPRCSVLALLRKPEGARGRVTELRHALRSFFDHAALSATGLTVSHRSVHLYGDRDGPPGIVPLDALEQNAARGWLTTLVRELLSRPHAYLMPCEAVLRLADRWNAVRGEDLVASIAEVRDRWDGGQSRFGPVRDPLRYAPLAPGDAEVAAEQRFGLFFRSLRGGSS